MNLMECMKKKEFTMFANGLLIIWTMILAVCSVGFMIIFMIMWMIAYPHVVVILGEYQYKAAFVADQEINMMACLTEIMGR